MLGRELPRLFEGRVREDLIRRLRETERTLTDDPYLDQWLTEESRKRSALPTAPPSLDLSTLDTAPTQRENREEENCQNEPAPAALANPPVSGGPREAGRWVPAPPELGAGGPSAHPLPEGEVSWLANSEGSLAERSPVPPLLGARGPQGGLL